MSMVELVFFHFPPDMLQKQGGGYAEPLCHPGIKSLCHPKTSFPPVCKGGLPPPRNTSCIDSPELPHGFVLPFLPADSQEYRCNHDKCHKRNADSCLCFHNNLSPPSFSCSLPPERRTRRFPPRIRRIRQSTTPRCSHRPSLAW